MSLREKARVITSLAVLLEGLEGKVVSIELRNESAVRGRLNAVDSEMNCQMTRVTFRNTRGDVRRFENFYIKGPNIRFVHIPDSVNVMSTIQAQVEWRTEARRKGLQSSSRRTSMALSRQLRRQNIEKKLKQTQDKLAAMMAETQPTLVR